MPKRIAGRFERISLGADVETTAKKRDRSLVYETYLDTLRVGTELDDGATARA